MFPIRTISNTSPRRDASRIGSWLIALQLANDRFEIARADAGLAELTAERLGAAGPLAQLTRELAGAVGAHPVRPRVALRAPLRRRELVAAISARGA